MRLRERMMVGGADLVLQMVGCSWWDMYTHVVENKMCRILCKTY